MKGGALIRRENIKYYYMFNYYIEIFDGDKFSHIILASYYEIMRFIQLDKAIKDNNYNFIIRILNHTELYKSKTLDYKYPENYYIIKTIIGIIFNNINITSIDILKLLDIEYIGFDKDIIENSIFKTNDTYRLCKLIGKLKYEDTLITLIALKAINDYIGDIDNTFKISDDAEKSISDITNLLKMICEKISKCENKEESDKYKKLLCQNTNIATFIYKFIINVFDISIIKNDLINIIKNNKDLFYKYWYATKYIYKIDKNIDIEIDKKLCV
jgi:hypothetical protein